MMNTDVIWTQIRNVLIVLSGVGVGLGLGSASEMSALVEASGKVFAAFGAIVYIGTTAWQWWVRWNTRAVPIETAVRADVPTISPMSGTREIGSEFPR